MVQNQRKLIIILFITAFIIGALFLLLKPKRLQVTVTAIPNDSTITLGGKTIKNGKVTLTPGIHVLKASRQYFDAHSVTIDTAKIDSPKQTIYLLPKANSPEARQWLIDHPTIQQEIERVGGINAARVRQQLISDYPILTSLPHETLDYKISYSTGIDPKDYSIIPAQKVSFIVTLYPIADPASNNADYKQQLKEYKNKALKYLKDNDIDPIKETITFSPNPN